MFSIFMLHVSTAKGRGKKTGLDNCKQKRRIKQKEENGKKKTGKENKKGKPKKKTGGGKVVEKRKMR